jgi:anti-sigma factor RsiW
VTPGGGAASKLRIPARETGVNCREFVEFLIDYLEGELPAAQARLFDAHLAACPRCVDYLATYRETVRLGRLLAGDPEGPVPADVPEELVRAILAAREARGRP